MYFIGQVIGGIIAVYLLSKLVEWAVIKRVMDDAIKGGFVSVAIGYALAAILYGFGEANGGPWIPNGFLLYMPGAVVVALVRMIMRKRRIEEAAD